VYAHLRSSGIDVWWDQNCMPNRALTFVEEIRDAVHRAERLVVVIGPKALSSDYVRAEWQAGLAGRKPVVPVLRRVPDGTEDPYTCLPPELRFLHAPSALASGDVEPSLKELTRILGDPVPPPAPILGGPPERPPHFRPRPDAFSEVFDCVLGELTSTRVHAAENRVTVLTGMGGTGKSVLAASLVEAMRSRPTTFLEDGIYWLRGDWRTESPLLRLAALCGERIPDAQDVRAVEDAVTQRLRDQRFLLVVDDALAVAQLTPLVRVLGPGGRMLVTTRHGELATGHQRVAIEPFDEADALALVADWLGIDAEEVPADARRVVALCGRHPFAIAVNAAAASQGLAWSTIAAALERNQLDFAEHEFEEYVYATVDASLAVSVEGLMPPQRERYRELAAFFWESGVPASAVSRFWERRGRLPAHEAERLLVLLRQRSLVSLAGSPERYEVGLHELHRAYLARDEDVAAALAADLLESYRPASPHAWWDVADDGYLSGHLVRHLIRSRPQDELVALLCATDDRRRNRWYHARVEGRADGFAGYVADVALAAGRVPDSLQALITASLRSIARAVPAPLLEAAVNADRWSLERAIAHARLIAEPARRASAMTALLPQVEDRATWLADTLDAIGRSDVAERRPLLDSLADLLTPAELPETLRRAVGWVKEAATPFERRHAALLVHPVLSRVTASGAAEAVRILTGAGIEVPLYLCEVLSEPERSTRIRGALDEARAEPGEIGVFRFALTVSQVASYFEPMTAAAMVAEALAAARALDPGVFRHGTLLQLLPQLSPGDRDPTLDELIGDALRDPSEFAELASGAPPETHGRIRAALETQDLAWIARAAPVFTGEHREALVDRALTEIEARSNAASLLWIDGAELILAMNDQQIARARRVINEQLEGSQRVRALAAVARASSRGRRERAVDDALAAVEGLSDRADRERGYREIALLLEPHQLAAALAAAERIGEPSGIRHLPAMVRHLSPGARERLIELLHRHARASAFWDGFVIVSALPEGLESPALDRLLDLGDGLEPAEEALLLTHLAARITEQERKPTQTRARAAIDRLDSPVHCFQLLLELGDAEAAERALIEVAPTVAPDELATYVATLVPHLPDDRRERWIGAVLARADRGRYVLERLGPCLGQHEARSYLASLIMPDDVEDERMILEAIDHDLPFAPADDKAPAAAALTRRMVELGAAEDAYALLRLGRDDDVTLSGLVEVASHLSRDDVLHIEERLVSTTVSYFTVVDNGTRISNIRPSYLLGRLVPALARVGEVRSANAHAAATDAELRRVDAYIGIATWTQGEARSNALAAAIATVQDLRDVHREKQLGKVGKAVARDPRAAAVAWPNAVEWAGAHPRDEAIEMLAFFAPVAAAVGGTALVDEAFDAIERVLQWWP
jgi:hypothetical protein